MIHPEPAADPFLAPLHRSFLIGSFVCGALALLVLPLHLALAGPPHAAMLLVLSWMLSQWPLALYLSRSGALDRAVGLSSGLFACVVTAVCFLTGGAGSFALIWLIVPPVEASLATNRKTMFGVTALCVLLLAAIVAVPVSLTHFEPLPWPVRILSTFAALIYAGVLANRILLDRKQAREAVNSSSRERQLVSQSVSEVLCELDADRAVRVIGGPVRQMLGMASPFSGASSELLPGGDWLFSRLHVADRPLYLTRLADVRHTGSSARFEVRLRVGASNPGDVGQADYKRLEFYLRTVEADVLTEGGNGKRTLLSIRDAEMANPDELFIPAGLEAPGTEKISRALQDHASGEAKAAFADIISQSARLETENWDPSQEGFGDAVLNIKKAGETGLAALNAVSEFGQGREAGAELEYRSVDLNASLDRCARLLKPIADRFGVDLEVEPFPNAPEILADGKLLRQSLCLVLSDMIETAGNGAVVNMAGVTVPSGPQILLAVKNRKSCLSWSAENSKPVLRFANGLFERIGGSLSLQTMLGHGESVVLRLPSRAGQGAASARAGDLTEDRSVARLRTKTA